MLKWKMWVKARVTSLRFYLKCLEKRRMEYGNVYNSYLYGWALLSPFTFLNFQNALHYHVVLFFKSRENLFQFWNSSNVLRPFILVESKWSPLLSLSDLFLFGILTCVQSMKINKIKTTRRKQKEKRKNLRRKIIELVLTPIKKCLSSSL